MGTKPREVARAVEEMKKSMPDLFTGITEVSKKATPSQQPQSPSSLPNEQKIDRALSPASSEATEQLARSIHFDEESVRTAGTIAKKWGQELDEDVTVRGPRGDNIRVAMLYLWTTAVGIMGEMARQSQQAKKKRVPPMGGEPSSKRKKIKRENDRVEKGGTSSASMVPDDAISSPNISLPGPSAILPIKNEDNNDNDVKNDLLPLPPIMSSQIDTFNNSSPFIKDDHLPVPLIVTSSIDALDDLLPPVQALDVTEEYDFSVRWESWLNLCQTKISPSSSSSSSVPLYPPPGGKYATELLDNIVASSAASESSRSGVVDVLTKVLWPMRGTLLSAAHVIMLGDQRKGREAAELATAMDLMVMPKRK
eukprot:CAMPEP_0113323882 /NCGR_PEP_ID=MMETSP0010_2-20120614/16644_1 /TAXON_ID=216773 ORGANISM="Corethron hystrix, Strain 308" /NCGR_SAMPLE_ID=MMETSP0010_2 /ASSEMBLY_ACC=CAM_ASM_000155 /LENGTH=365 /DNA_ID=CAMNT_0000183015 /DNA_START=22 /DNA_END=1119 /DNA_ORIENTATION=+ /assembly_acc=CAM_ASM_000155